MGVGWSRHFQIRRKGIYRRGIITRSAFARSFPRGLATAFACSSVSAARPARKRTVAANLNRPRRIFDRVPDATSAHSLPTREGRSLTQQPPSLRIRLTVVSVALAIVVVGLLNAPWS